ncbi:TPA: Hsp20/alpha crystallin family protein [Candidatus Peregrinibacteria bacterium]|nr:Hsp20/alpha crystallin family protein [Candidatus Peregrinibacteria bacterium]
MQQIKIDGIKQNHTLAEEEVELSMDIFEADNTIFVLIPLAGISIENIKIQLSKDVLTISGTREIPEDIQHYNAKKYFVEECHWGKFSRSIVLPEIVESANIRASEHNGILKVIIPKTKKVDEKQIHVQQQNI